METKYKAGFTYHDKQGNKCTLLEFVDLGMDKRWRVMYEFAGVSAEGWTDDRWIDLATDKAFFNARTNKIVYYDEVDIIPKNNLTAKT